MCGIVGFAGFFEPGLLARMCNAVAHRGPDGEGQAEFAAERMAIGMRRLAIIDLVTGNQPFVTKDGRVALVLNGEIYNFRELREELRALGHSFHTRSDTEVVLAAYVEWGKAAWKRLHGMFAIAIVDRRQSAPQLLIVRDRVGMKPLYYCEHNGCLAFASEIKALLAWSCVSRDVDLGALRDYLALRYVPGPRCLLRGVQRLPAGHMLLFQDGKVSIDQWWAPPVAAAEAGMSAAEASHSFGEALRTAVARHLVSDVPLGAFLSGGVDSNVIVALMAEVSAKPVHTFSIGFPDFPHDELDRAAITAEIYATDHTAIECRAADMASLPDIVWALDEPVGDPIIVPLYVLSREAHRKVKVVLSGEGGDEVMGGYVFHRNLTQLERWQRFMPACAWPLLARVVEALPAALLDRAFDYPGKLGTEGRRKVAALVGALRHGDVLSRYRDSVSLFDADDIADVSAAAELCEQARRAVSNEAPWPVRGSALDQLIAIQFRDWLPDLILGKLDKLTMAHSLEGRVPFMDDAVIAAAARIPAHRKLVNGSNKKPLRDFARSLLPPRIANAAKAAFYIPLESYIRSPELRDFMGWALDPDRIAKRGLFDPQWAGRVLNSVEAAGFLPLKRVFSVLMLELWFERFCPEARWS
jgi:asparagine synthase (glutamine-hydrolysing)